MGACARAGSAKLRNPSSQTSAPPSAPSTRAAVSSVTPGNPGAASAPRRESTTEPPTRAAKAPENRPRLSILRSIAIETVEPQGDAEIGGQCCRDLDLNGL